MAWKTHQISEEKLHGEGAVQGMSACNPSRHAECSVNEQPEQKI
jgi:hypothetical protein